jgi:hypothetical protein
MIVAPMATSAGVEMTSTTVGSLCQCSAEGGCCVPIAISDVGNTGRDALRVGRCHSVGKIVRVEVKWRLPMSLDHGQ